MHDSFADHPGGSQPHSATCSVGLGLSRIERAMLGLSRRIMECQHYHKTCPVPKNRPPDPEEADDPRQRYKRR